MNKWYAAHIDREGERDAAIITDWDNLFWASNVLLAGLTDQGAFHIATQVRARRLCVCVRACVCVCASCVCATCE